MSTESHSSKSEHGTVGSYVIGFVLSLIYTFLPYQLVVNKILTGNALILAILGIAVLQMAIQLLFFLHLGRGPKPLYNVVFFFATAGIIVLTIGASIFIMNNLYHNMSPSEVTVRMAQEESIDQIGGENTGACGATKESHIVTIENGQLNPDYIQAERCDKLTFVNNDNTDYTFGFGSVEEKQSYGGHFELTSLTDRPETITLNQAGGFTLFDQSDPSRTGRILVNE